MLHPIFVLLGIMFAGIFVYPMMKAQELVPKDRMNDAVVVTLLILLYLAYKAWFNRQKR